MREQIKENIPKAEIVELPEGYEATDTNFGANRRELQLQLDFRALISYFELWPDIVSCPHD